MLEEEVIGSPCNSAAVSVSVIKAGMNVFWGKKSIILSKLKHAVFDSGI